MKKFSFLWLICFSLVLQLQAQSLQSFDVALWPDGFPNLNGWEDSIPQTNARWVARPVMRVFLPDTATATGRVVVALPGGGYSHLSKDNEGNDWAPFFNQKGIALVVLCYRMPRGNYEVPTSDVYEAIRYVRSHAAEWKIDAGKLGIMGSSAGGHLASTVATHAPSAEVRPNFQILFYPVITMDSTFTHRGSRDNLIGKMPTDEMVTLFSNEMQVDSLTPPAILLCSDDDRAVPTPNSVKYYLALKQAGIPASLYIYPSGGHGFGARPKFKFHESMIANLSDWLDQLK